MLLLSRILFSNLITHPRNITCFKTDNEFDTVVFNKNNSEPIRRYKILAGMENQKKNLLENFPDEQEAIEK